MTETRSTSTTRVKAHRARKSRGVHLAQVVVPEAQVDRLADEGYLNEDNTVAQAIEAFLAHHVERLAEGAGLKRPSPQTRYATRGRERRSGCAVLAHRIGASPAHRLAQIARLCEMR